MTSIALNSALSGLKAAQNALNTVSTNISNAQTAGYTRKILPQQTLLVGGLGQGVLSGSLIRKIDKTLQGYLVKQLTTTSAAAVNQTYLQRISDFNGASDEQKAISFKMADLAASFTRLSDSPDNALSLQSTLLSAQDLAAKFNDYSNMLTGLRNDANSEIADKVASINNTLRDLYEINARIANFTGNGQSTADLEDQRDLMVRELAKVMDITVYTADGNRLIIQTKRGLPLVDEGLHQLKFNPSPITPGSFYPGGGATGIYLDDTLVPTNEITPTEIGGEFGALFAMRDRTLPLYQAQLDEMAQKLATRLDTMGLRLFTNASGNVPASTTPPAPTGYAGFAAEIRVNAAIVADPTLLRNGTFGDVYPTGSNEIIRKISQYAFGETAFQRSTGTANISAGTLFTSLGLTQVNRLVGTVNLNSYTPDLDAAPNITAPASFVLDIGGTPYNINIAPGDTAATLVSTINTAVGSTVASLDGTGRLVLDTTSAITISDNTIGAAGIADLGLSFGTFPASNPSLTVQVGTQAPVTIQIAPGDTSATLLAALNAIPGLSATLTGGGALQIEPIRGGSISIQNTTGTPVTALGMATTNVAHTAFRTSNMGPNADITSALAGTNTLEGYGRSFISAQAEEHSRAKDVQAREEGFFNTLETRYADQSGVNIDEEIAELVRIQSAYTAAARVITAAEELMDELLNAFR
jgi:flagellar hook-associated protein 1 FlgK